MAIDVDTEFKRVARLDADAKQHETRWLEFLHAYKLHDDSSKGEGLPVHQSGFAPKGAIKIPRQDYLTDAARLAWGLLDDEIPGARQYTPVFIYVSYHVDAEYEGASQPLRRHIREVVKEHKIKVSADTENAILADLPDAHRGTIYDWED